MQKMRNGEIAVKRVDFWVFWFWNKFDFPPLIDAVKFPLTFRVCWRIEFLSFGLAKTDRHVFVLITWSEKFQVHAFDFEGNKINKRQVGLAFHSIANQIGFGTYQLTEMILFE